MEPIPWYQSAIVRQQIVQIVVAATALLGINLGDFKVDEVLASIFAGVAGLVGVWTLVTRIRKPAPNLSQAAIAKEVELVAEGKIPPSPTGHGSQRGFIRPAMLAALLGIFATLAVVGLPGCAGTKAAYKASSSVADTAYVVAEHYDALLGEAVEIAENPSTAPEVKEALKAADRAVKPLILGNPETGAPGLRQLASHYNAVKTADAQEDLQRAIDAAVIDLARLINAVKAARSNR